MALVWLGAGVKKGFVAKVVYTVRVRTSKVVTLSRGARARRVTKVGFAANALGNGSVTIMIYKINGIGTTVYTIILVRGFGPSIMVGDNINNSLSPLMSVKSVIITAGSIRRSVGAATLNSERNRISFPSNAGVFFSYSGAMIRGLARTYETLPSAGIRRNVVTDNSVFVSSHGGHGEVTSAFNTLIYRVRNTTVNCIYCTLGAPCKVVETVSSSLSRGGNISCRGFYGLTTGGAMNTVYRCLGGGWVVFSARRGRPFILFYSTAVFSVVGPSGAKNRLCRREWGLYEATYGQVRAGKRVGNYYLARA